MKSLNGYALVFALIFIVLISFLLFFIIEARKLESMSLNRNLEKQLALLNLKQILNNQILDYVELGTEEMSNVHFNNFDFSLKRSTWGLFPVISVEAFSSRDTFRLASLYGYQADSSALSILFERQDLILAGGVEIIGDVSLNEGSLRRGVVEGQYFPVSQQLNNGEQLKVDTGNVGILSRTINNLIKRGMYSSEEMTFKSQDNQVISNSFFEPLIYIDVSNEEVLAGKFVGNIVLSSNHHLIISKNARIDNCIVMAPSIYIEGDFMGRAQFFARDSISVSGYAVLEYPTVLAVYSENMNYIRIEKNVEYFGLVYSFSEVQASEIVIDEATVNGDIFTNGIVEMEGTVNGRIIAEKFQVKTARGVYENHIRNLKINSWEAQSELLMRPISFNSSNKLYEVCALN